MAAATRTRAEVDELDPESLAVGEESEPEYDVMPAEAFVLPAAVAPAAPTDQPLYAFYCTFHPNEKLYLGDQVMPVQFQNGYFGTSDKRLAAQIRAASKNGMYLEADMEKPIVCRKCGWASRSREAIERHYLGHME